MTQSSESVRPLSPQQLHTLLSEMSPDKFPHAVQILQLAQDTCVLQLTVGEDLCWFNGHFPNTPILPGVVQLNWARELSINIWPGQQGWLKAMTQLEVVKFQQVIRPGDVVNLELSIDLVRRRLVFAYTTHDGSHFSSGRLVACL